MRRCQFPLIGALVPLLLLFPGCNHQQRPDPWLEGERAGQPRLRVLTSIAPLYCFAAKVAGDKAVVRCLLTTNGPHEYDPTPSDIRLLGGADLLVLNGLGLEDWMQSLVASAGNRRMKVLETGKASPLENRLLQTDGSPCPHGHIHGKGTDPHIWLGLDEAIIQVEAIRDKLIEMDPANEKSYRDNAAEFVKKLAGLKEHASPLGRLSGSIITFHDAFKYFTRSVGMKEFPETIRSTSGQEIGGGQLPALAKKFRDRPGKIIITIEPQYQPKIAETLAREIGRDRAVIVTLDPLETATATGDYQLDKDHYLKKMRENVDNLLEKLK